MMITWLAKNSLSDWIAIFIGAIAVNIVLNSNASIYMFIFDTVCGAMLGGFIIIFLKKYSIRSLFNK